LADPLLDIRDLKIWFKVFEGQLKVINGVNLKIWPGEKVGLIGEMGCGKTTTMKAVTKLLSQPPARIVGGEILFKGKNILKMGRREFQQIRQREISMIFEDPTAALNPVFTVGTQIRDAVRYSGVLGEKTGKEAVMAKAIQALEEVSLPDPERVLKNYPIQLSGGMRQRICIALALLSANTLLIADEPDTSLDVTIKDQILRLLNEVVEKKGTSVILITHSLGAVRKMTDRLYVMYAGTMIENARTNDFFSDPKHPYSQVLLAAAPRLTGGGIGQGIQGRIPEYLNPPPGCRFHSRCEKATPICREKKPPNIQVGPEHEVACHLYS